MLTDNSFRPWGEIGWTMKRYPANKWDFLGCVATEERCLSAYNFLVSNNLLLGATFYEIVDPFETSEHGQMRDRNRSKLSEEGIENINIEDHKLLESSNVIISSILTFLSKSSGNIILDISCFPKRFFFPIIKFILRNSQLSNFLVVYSGPHSYSQDRLSDNPQPWMNIPTFISDEEDGNEVSIVGLGFMPLGLPDVLGTDNSQGKRFYFMFSFPPGPPFTQRTWAFIREISNYRKIDTRELIRVDSSSLPEMFDKIHALTNNGLDKAIFAPFGPKPMSLAMCLYACQSKSAVYYTQPTSYNPLYSSGTSTTLAYCIVINQRNLYQL